MKRLYDILTSRISVTQSNKSSAQGLLKYLWMTIPSSQLKSTDKLSTIKLSKRKDNKMMLVANHSKNNNNKSTDNRNIEETRFLERDNNSGNHKEETYFDMKNRITNTEIMNTNKFLERN